jgi:hypothetical protein
VLEGDGDLDTSKATDRRAGFPAYLFVCTAVRPLPAISKPHRGSCSRSCSEFRVRGSFRTGSQSRSKAKVEVKVEARDAGNDAASSPFGSANSGPMSAQLSSAVSFRVSNQGCFQSRFQRRFDGSFRTSFPMSFPWSIGGTAARESGPDPGGVRAGPGERQALGTGSKSAEPDSVMSLCYLTSAKRGLAKTTRPTSVSSPPWMTTSSSAPTELAAFSTTTLMPPSR